MFFGGSISNASAGVSEETIVEVNLNANLSHQQRVSQIAHLATAGVTPTFRPGWEEWMQLKNMGLRRIRLINVDRSVKVFVQSNGDLRINWSKKLKDELFIAKQKNLIPFIVVAQAPPVFYGSNSNNKTFDKHHRGLYRKYMAEFAKYVTEDWGFHYSEWEIGNEFNNPHNNWLAPKGLPRNDPQLFGYYMDLYRNISSGLADYRKANSSAKLLIGGPGFSDGVFYNKEAALSWNQRFLDVVIKENIPCDFLSMHFYGSAGGARQFNSAVKFLKDSILKSNRTIQLYVSEWGINAFKDGWTNSTEVAGAYALSFIVNMASSGIDEAMFLGTKAREVKKEKSGRSQNQYPVEYPVLFDSHGKATHHFNALNHMSKWRGDELSCNSNIERLHCLAFRESDGGIIVALWHLDWSTEAKWIRKMIDRKVSRPIAIKLNIKISGIVNARIERNGKKCSIDDVKCINVSLTRRSQGLQIKIPSFEEGSYAFIKLDN